MAEMNYDRILLDYCRRNCPEYDLKRATVYCNTDLLVRAKGTFLQYTVAKTHSYFSSQTFKLKTVTVQEVPQWL